MCSHSNGISKTDNVFDKESKRNHHLPMSLGFLSQELYRHSKANNVICVLLSQSQSLQITCEISKFHRAWWSWIYFLQAALCYIPDRHQARYPSDWDENHRATHAWCWRWKQWVNSARIFPTITELLLLQRKEAFALPKWSLRVTGFSWGHQ